MATLPALRHPDQANHLFISRRLVEKYRAIFDWDVPDIDQNAADKLILVEVRKIIRLTERRPESVDAGVRAAARLDALQFVESGAPDIGWRDRPRAVRTVAVTDRPEPSAPIR
jgi:hypothetical protein